MTLKHYLQKADKQGFVLGQFNFATAEQLRGIAEAALELQAPVIVGTSSGEAGLIGLEQAAALVASWRQKAKASGQQLAMFLNLDHAKDLALIEQAIKAGYDSVHFDGSELAFAQNLQISQQVVKLAKAKKVLVEGEVGRIGSSASRVYTEQFVLNEADLTKPAQATEFVAATGVDLLALSLGSFHGVQASGQEAHLDLPRLQQIVKLLPKTFLVLHGSSGTNEADVRQAIAMGIDKVNVNTDLRVVFTKALREQLAKDLQEVTPYKYLAASIQATKQLVKERIHLFGAAGQA